MDKDLIDQFALGKAPYSELSQAAVDALKKRAGYMPGKVDADLPRSIVAKFDEMFPHGKVWSGNEMVAANWSDALDAWLQDEFGKSLEDINDLQSSNEWDYVLSMVADRIDRVHVPVIAEQILHEHCPKVNGVIQLPTMKVPGFTSDYLLEWTQGRAWIAGGYVVSELRGNADKVFVSNDVDVFCWTDEVYEEMVAELKKSRWAGILDENDRSILVNRAVIGNVESLHPINLVRPCGEDWSEPYHVLKDFDLTCSAALLKNGEEAYVWNPSHIEHGLMSLIQLKHPMKTIGRVFKYWGRGFAPTANLWNELVKNEHASQMLTMISPLTHVFPDCVELETLALTTGELEPQTSFMPYYDDDEDYWYEDDYDDYY